jgi:predicted PurR-regulated permease PerM
MKKSTKLKSTKIEISPEPVESKSVKRGAIGRIFSTTLSFISGFVIIVGLVLGVYWYGKQASKKITSIFQQSLSTNSLVQSTTQLYDPLDIFDEVRNKNSSRVFLDVRSTEEYEKEHIKGALSLPIYTIKNDHITYMDFQHICQIVLLSNRL